MKTGLIKLLVLSFLAAGIWACSKNAAKDEARALSNPNLPSTPMDYKSSEIPTGFITGISDNTPFDNQITDDGATLGRVLFYDRALSVNNVIACGSCHHQQFGFADNMPFSTGFAFKSTARNSSAIVNLRITNDYFWDARANKLEDMVLMPVRHQVEMGMENSEYLVKKLASIPYYPELFKKAFGTQEVTKDRVGKAIAQFLRSMVTVRSAYDDAKNSGFTNFNAQQRRGHDLFQQNCASCHSGDNFSAGWGGDKANIGLDLDPTDQGMMAVTNSTMDKGVFKIPSLRNIALTAPYMHDGRYATLEQVVEHYNSGIQPAANLDWRLLDSKSTTQIDPMTGRPINIVAKKMNMNESDKMALVEFLKTLTDNRLMTDTRFSDPFKN